MPLLPAHVELVTREVSQNGEFAVVRYDVVRDDVLRDDVVPDRD
jgi:hypothetical protein